MKIVVTGGAGRLGQLTTKELVAYGHDLLALDKTPIPDPVCPSSIVDLSQAQELANMFQRADAVIHLARRRFPYTSNGFEPVSRTWKIPDVFGDAENFSYNVTITYNVVAAAFAAGVKKLVMGSSLTIYGFYYPTRFAAPGIHQENGYCRRGCDSDIVFQNAGLRPEPSALSGCYGC